MCNDVLLIQLSPRPYFYATPISINVKVHAVFRV